MTATERLRELLDERGVEWSAQDRFTRDVETRWLFPASSAQFTEYEDGMTIMVISGAEWTPEQAIAATLGRGTCHNTQTDFDFQCSECGQCLDNGRMLGVRYCPNCGRRIVEVDE